jgi:hypothetical protein
VTELPPVPQNIDAEERVIGAMMISAKAIDASAEVLGNGADFYRASHMQIYRAARELHSRGEPVDTVTLAAELERKGKLEEIGGRVRIKELAAVVPAASNVAHYARIVAEEAAKRALLREIEPLAERARNGGLDPAEARAVLERAIVALPDRRTSVLPLATTRLSSIDARSVVFIDAPLWLRSGFHLCVGRKGVGKGTTLSDLAARFTRGEFGAKRNVIWIATEDDAAIDIRPRIEAAKGDPEHVHVVTDWIQLPRDIESLRTTIELISDVSLVIIDPVGNHITGKKANDDTDVRDAIAPLNHLSDDLETLLVGVRHITEKEASGGVLAAILGSSAWVQVPRVVIAVVRDDEDASVSHVQCVAGNRLPPGTSGRAFRIEGVQLPGLENEVTRAVLIGDSTKDAETLLGATKQESKSARARELILDVLEEAPELQMESDTLDALISKRAGLAASTVRQLRADLKNAGLVKALPVKDEFGQVLGWNVARTQAPRGGDIQ